MPATSPNSGPFDAAVWEGRMAGTAAAPIRREILDPPDVLAPPIIQSLHTMRLRRASRLLRKRLDYLEAPRGPLSPQRKRLLSHQANRLSRVVEALLLTSRRQAA
jgi:hypothetical protein